MKNRHSIARHRDGIQRLIFENGVEYFIFVVTAERRLPQEHFIHKHSEGPPIHGTSVALFQQDLIDRVIYDLPITRRVWKQVTYFWGHKFRSATKSASCLPVTHLFLTQTVIADFDVTVKSKENVVELEIPANGPR